MKTEKVIWVKTPDIATQASLFFGDILRMRFTTNNTKISLKEYVKCAKMLNELFMEKGEI